MINTYEEYLSQIKILTIEQMNQIHKNMIEEIGTNQEALELYDELLEIATKYVAIRSKWLLMSREEKLEQDSLRTSYHNSTIIHFNMLSRYLKQQGKATIWREELGNEEENEYCRKTIGDFACYLVFINSINAR
ncbi:MAG: hypothetical protein K1V96_06615 [Lachnospiraceae bacterium]